MLTKILKAMAPISSCSNDAQLDTELFRPGLGTAIADFYRDPVVTLHLPTYVYDGTVWLSSLVGASSTSASAEATGEGGGGVEAGRADSPLATPHFGARMRTRDRTRHNGREASGRGALAVRDLRNFELAEAAMRDAFFTSGGVKEKRNGF